MLDIVLDADNSSKAILAAFSEAIFVKKTHDIEAKHGQRIQR